MDFKNDSINQISKISKKEEWSYFFDNMKNKPDQSTQKLIEELALIFMYEYNLPFSEQSKVEFFITLGFFARKNI